MIQSCTHDTTKMLSDMVPLLVSVLCNLQHKNHGSDTLYNTAPGVAHSIAPFFWREQKIVIYLVSYHIIFERYILTH